MLGQHELKPSETTELKIVYNTYKFPGKFEKYVYVELGGEEGRRETITLHGEVEPIPMGALEVNPRKLDAGSMALNAPVELELRMRNTGDAELRISGVVSPKHDLRYFDEAKDGPLVIAPGESKPLTIAVTARQKGRFMDYVMIHAEARNVTEAGYKVVVVGQCD